MSESNWAKGNLPPVHIVTIMPEMPEETLSRYRRCYMGISLDNPVFHGKAMEALLAWATQRFEHCLVIAGDYLRRHNEYILNGFSDGAAEQASLAAGEAFIEATRDIFAKAPADRVQLVRWRDCLAFDEYGRARAELDALFDADAAFKAAVREDATGFVTRQTRNGRRLVVPAEEAVEVSCRYLLEEIAVFSALSEKGWKVELYPGPELAVLVQAAKGVFSGIPRGLSERVNVQLKCGKGRTEGS